MLVLVLVAIINSVMGVTTYQTNVWKASTGYPKESDFPENTLLSDVFSKKRNVGIALSGGGVNAYASTTGVLAALNEYGLVKHLRYITAVSGSNWAMSGFTYTQKIKDDDTYLGPIIHPNKMTLTNLAQMNPGCVRRLLNSSFYQLGAKYAALYPASGQTALFLTIEQTFF